MGLSSMFGGGDGGDAKKAMQQALAASRAQRDKAVGYLGASQQPSMDYIRTGTADAAGAYGQGIDQGAQALQSQGGQAIGRLEPLAGAGMGALGNMQQSATAGGFASNINDLLMGGSLNPLIASNRRTLESELASQGLTRSGSGLTQMSQVPINTAMGIESSLQSRQNQIAGLGLPALSQMANINYGMGQGLSSLYGQQGGYLGGLYSQQGQMLSGLESAYGKNLANIELGQSANEQAAILGAQQGQAAAQQGNQQMLGAGLGFLGSSTGGSMLSSIGGMFGG